MRKYRVHELGKFRYSDIGEYVDEYHTDRPLRNDKLVDLLNEQELEIKQLKEENEGLKCFIRKLANDKREIMLMNGYGYKIDNVVGG